MNETLEQRLDRLAAMVGVLIQKHRPTIGFAEVKDLLEVESDSAVHTFLARHKIQKTTRGRYNRLQVYEALSLRAAA